MRKIKIAHFAAFCPYMTGQYATVKDLIKAERDVGIDAQFIATYVNDKTREAEVSINKEDGWLKTVEPQWAEKADIIMRHSCVPPEYANLGIPMIMALHGRPESTFIIEYVGLMKIYQLISEVKNDYKYKGWITFWKEHEFFHKFKLPEDSVYYVPAMVDLEEYNPEGEKVIFKQNIGSPNIIIADMWRHDMTPYTMMYAVALFKKKYCPSAKVHVFGAPNKKADSLLKVMKQNGVMGNMMHRCKPMANVYRGGDLLVTPHNIATRVVRESLACGLPIVAGSANPYTDFKADPKDIEDFAKQINRCWQSVQKDPKQIKRKCRRIAEENFNTAQSGEALLKAVEDVLKKELNNWKRRERVFFKEYKTYDDYVSHQTSKMKNVLTSVGKEYNIKYRVSLVKRLKMLKDMKRLEAGMSVLCLGARDGTEVMAFHDAGLFAVGVDLYPVSPNHVLRGDFQKLPYPSNSVDVIFMNCIDHVYDLDALLKDIIRILKPSGLFLVDFSAPISVNTDRWASCRWKDPIDIKDYIKNRGFSVEVVQTFNDGYFIHSICFRSLGGIFRSDIINSFIRKYNCKNYLEIGSGKKETFNKVVCESKTSVDPNHDSDYKMTSDGFFAQCNSDIYDIIFIDGRHTAEQVYKDINNSLKHLKKGGFILLHDCNPTQKYLQVKENDEDFDENGNWCGDGWKAFARIRMTRDDLTAYVIDRDYGVGVLYKGGQTIYSDNKEINELDWDYLEKNRKDLLRLTEPASWITKTT